MPIGGGAASFRSMVSLSGRRSRAKSQATLCHRHEDGSPFGLGGLWENWKDPTSGEWIRTFAIITTDANELVGEIHDRMPLILAPGDYARWLSDEPDPRDLMRPFPAEPMRM
jgi:putative SOS response-associated peptidase YedK